MSGSSRSLSKQLNNLFENDCDYITEEVETSIEQYLSKHNTLASISQASDLNDELFSLYDSYIKGTSHISKQYVFLDIVTKLSPTLNWNQIHLWLVTYMRPAIDSAGYDLKFVNKCKTLITNLINFLTTQDARLLIQRLEISKNIVCIIIDIFIGKDYSLIDLKVPTEQDQMYLERLRFVKQNCQTLLASYGEANSRQYLVILCGYLELQKYRLDVLLLISSQLCSFDDDIHPSSWLHLPFHEPHKSSSAHSKDTTRSSNIDSKLIHIILDGLLYDLNDSTILAQLSITITIITQTDDTISNYIDKLFAIFFRLCFWESIKKVDFTEYQKLLDQESVTYKPLPAEKPNEYVLSKIDQQLSQFGTLLYGLFPLHFSKFCGNPIEYFGNKKVVSMSITIDLTNLSRSVIIEKMKGQYMTFLVHPKFIDIDSQSLEDELANPTKWIRDSQTDKELNEKEQIGPAEISLACFALNPDFVTEFLITQHHSGFGSAINSKHVSRNSSYGGQMSFNIKDGPSAKLFLNNFNRKLSIVNTNLVIDSKSQAISSRLNQSIKFRDVKFGDGYADDSSVDDVSKGPLNDLFSTHESLFHRESSLNSIANLSTTNSTTNLLKMKTSSPNVKLDLSDLKELETANSEKPTNSEKPENSSEAGSIRTGQFTPTTTESDGKFNPFSSPVTSVDTRSNTDTEKHSGSALDFYHRELLLLKNELEFCSYMKYINKFNYIKLKMKLKKQFLQPALDQASDKNIDSVTNLNKSMTDLVSNLKKFESEHHLETSKLISRLQELQQENKLLQDQLSDLNDDYNSLNSCYISNAKEVIPQKDYEIDNLKNRLVELDELLKVMESNKESGQSLETSKPKDTTQINMDDEVFQLNQEIINIRDQNNKLCEQLKAVQEQNDTAIRTFESRQEAIKLEARESINSYIKHYDKKIEQLSTTILKYEGLLEEKNNRILQFTSSKPISIPQSSIGTSIPSNDVTDILEINREGFSSSDSFYSHLDGHGSRTSPQGNATPHTQTGLQFPFPDYVSGSRPTNNVNTTNAQQQPILRGRGGYQKRSKKM
jgi:hypothetical protein